MLQILGSGSGVTVEGEKKDHDYLSSFEVQWAYNIVHKYLLKWGKEAILSS